MTSRQWTGDWRRRRRAVHHVLFGAALLAVGCLAQPLSAQQADIIRGRIAGADGKAIESAVVQATSIPNAVNRAARTAKDGRFTITFPGGDGDYWITVTAIGFAPKRFELKRVADEEILIADASLARTTVVLDAVKIRANRDRPGRNDIATDVSGTEKSIGAGSVDPTQAGNLAAMAASLPGVQLIPGADGNPDQFSVFGLGGDQNNATLNGLGFGGNDIPRDAATRSSLGTSPWDVSRGGFSGGQFGLTTQSGSNFSTRGLSSLLNAPPLQWTDRAGRSLGAEYTSLSLGAATAGPIATDRSFYSAGYQFDRRFSDLPNLTTADPFALGIAGVAPDSVSRLRDILGRAGVPMSAAGIPATRVSERGLLLASFDVSPPASTSGQALNITAVGSFNRLNSPFAQITALPTNDARSTSWFGAVQGRHTNYFGSGVFTETLFGISRLDASTNPYLAFPNGGVRVSSTLDDGSTAVTGLSFGGSQIQRMRNGSTSVGGQNQLSWFSLDNRHRIKLTSSVRYEQFDQDLTSNQLGTFAYNSLADLEAARPSSFSRQLSPRVRRGSQIIGGVSLGDSYRPRADLQIQYGIRIDGNRFLSLPASNPAVRQTFGVDNDAVPQRIYLSPRIGFAWTYGHAAQVVIGNGFARGPRAVVRGGVGVFQNTPGVQLIGAALSNTGLPNAVQQLTCVGAAVPTPEWLAYRADPAAIPSRCADGTSGTVFASSVPQVTLFDRSYAAQRSVRSNMNWSGAVLGNRFLSTIDATWSLNLAQPGAMNLNFNPLQRFQLADEGGRPVYAQMSSIVSSSGAIAPDDARLDPAWGFVMQQRSDLSSTSRQLSLALQPLSFSTRYSWGLAYVYSNTRDVVRGFTSTAGDPRGRDRARSGLDSRHQLIYSLSYNFFDWLPVSWTGSFRSGRPFSPLVGGDVNGDGLPNDRAFIFDPATPTLEPSLASAMRSLIDGGSTVARGCLTRQLGRLAARNSCQGPWISTSNLTIALNPVRFRLPQRLNVSLYVNNALGAADLLLHGDNNRRGWGQSVAPDQTLLYVRGFDRSARRFRYEVNPRFGATRPGQTLNRNPVVVTAQLRMDIGFTRERQLLTQSLDRGRIRPGIRSTDQDIRGMSGTLIPPNPMALILQQADSLKLTRQQADSLATLNRTYTLAFDAIWTPVAKYLSTLPTDYDRAAAYDRYRRARERSIDALVSTVPAIRRLLTPQQLRLLPALITSSLDTRYLASVRSSTAGGASMGALGLLAQMGWMGGTVDASSSAVMLHR